MLRFALSGLYFVVTYLLIVPRALAKAGDIKTHLSGRPSVRLSQKL